MSYKVVALFKSENETSGAERNSFLLGLELWYIFLWGRDTFTNDKNDKVMIVYRGRNISNPVSTGVQRAFKPGDFPMAS